MSEPPTKSPLTTMDSSPSLFYSCTLVVPLLRDKSCGRVPPPFIMLGEKPVMVLNDGYNNHDGIVAHRVVHLWNNSCLHFQHAYARSTVSKHVSQLKDLTKNDGENARLVHTFTFSAGNVNNKVRGCMVFLLSTQDPPIRRSSKIGKSYHRSPEHVTAIVTAQQLLQPQLQFFFVRDELSAHESWHLSPEHSQQS